MTSGDLDFAQTRVLREIEKVSSCAHARYSGRCRVVSPLQELRASLCSVHLF
jgi:hypothetical protein